MGVLRKIEVDFPQDVFLAMKSVGFSVTKLKREMKEATAMDLFKRGLLSLGKAAELADMCLADFLDLLRSNGIQAFEYTEEDYKRELKTIRELRRR